MVQEISSTDWPRFCDAFERLHRGSIMTLLLVDSQGVTREVARDLSLQKMRYDNSDACSDRLWITLGLEGKREINHEVIEPIHVKLREESEGTKALQIDAENGSTLVRFHSGKFEELLDSLKG